MLTIASLPNSLIMLLFAILPSILAVPKVIASPLNGIPLEISRRALPIGTTTQAVAFDYSPNPQYNENEHLRIVNLFKRGCTLPQGGVCSEGAACCNNPKSSGRGWCCNSGKLCGDGEDETYCMLSTVFTTITTTSTDVITEGSAPATRVAETTDFKTETWTTVLTITELNAATATEIVTVTVTGNAARRRAVATSPPSITTPLPRQPPILPRQTSIPKENHYFHIRDLFPRQEVAKKVTSTVTVTQKTTSTRTATGFFTDFFTETRTSTVTSTITQTIAPNAQTTVTSTWSFTILPGETAIPLITGSAPPQTTDRKEDEDKGLTTGAQAGIGVGVGVVALAGLGLGFFFWRRRRSQQQPTKAELAGNHVDTSYGNNTGYPNPGFENTGYMHNSMKPAGQTYAYSSLDQGGAHEMYGSTSYPAPVAHELPPHTGIPAEMPGSEHPTQGYPKPVAAHQTGQSAEMSSQNYH